jgi:BirA family transcriptional regulator, biotin operon repressor / biotin---[acetyl-CoA-carboxylase] ligase
MKIGHASLLSIISDGELHSGEALASQLNISRAAIWKSIKQLESLGLLIESVQSKGYRLAKSIELLSENKIRSLLSAQATQSCSGIDILFKTESTNSYLFNLLASENIHGKVVLAEYQSHGRGRRGNKWYSPLGSGLIVSMGWRFDVVPKDMSLLSLYIGVAIARALQSEKIEHVGLKWPNDIIVDDKKLGGILIEVRGETSGPVDVVIGVGLNYDLSVLAKARIEQPVTDICSHSKQSLSRNNITAVLLSNIFEVLESMKAEQSSALLDEWRALDCYIGQRAKLLLPNVEVEGVLKGVDDQGSLLMSVSGQIKSFNSGQVSLRATT